MRQAHNELCHEVEAICGLLNGLIAQTFTGAIDENMLADALADKINGKADSTALTAAQQQLAQINTVLGGKTSVLAGKYIGDSTEERTIELGVTPSAVLLMQEGRKMYVNGISYGALAVAGSAASNILALTDTGFTVYTPSSKCALNSDGSTYNYIALY